MSIEPDTELLFELMMIGAATSAIVGAEGCGLLEALIDGQDCPGGFAERLSVDRCGVERVLQVLVTNGLAERRGDRYGASQKLRMAGALEGFAQHTAIWKHVTPFLQTGEPYAPFATDRGQAYGPIVERLGKMFVQPARRLTDLLASEPAEQILDIGAGSGVWSLTMAERHPGAQVTALDLPAVLGAFQRSAELRGLGARVGVMAGDYGAVEVPAGRYDRLLFANVLRLEPPARAGALVSRWSAAIRPGGLMVIVDTLSNGSAAAERFRAAYALHLALRTAIGYPHREDTIRAWLEQAGLRTDERIDLAGVGAMGVLIARK